MEEGNSHLIAYCGLYCGDCFRYKGNLADLARDLRKELREAKFDKTAEFMSSFSFFKVFKNYPQCYEVLGALVKMRCKHGCKEGGGPPFCKIRQCCQKLSIDGCWQCEDFESCEKLDFLRPAHGEAHLKNLKLIKKRGVPAFLAGKRFWVA